LITTFNPDPLLLTKLIHSIKNQVDKIIIVDNNSDKIILEDILKIAAYNNIKLILNNENFGIAKALNQGVLEARKMRYDWVIIFDQDSIPYNNIIYLISNVYELYPDKSRIGAIGVNALSPNSECYYHVRDQKGYCVTDFLITSGSLISIDAFMEVGGFREDYFIDNVDLEYSLRLRKYRKIILKTNSIGMIHEAGATIVKKFLGISISSTNHNIIRRYYMARNHVILSKDYFLKFPCFILKATYFFFLSLIKVLIVDNNKIQKIKASLKGIKDGILYNSKNQLSSPNKVK
jgi:rhamnosyltransferase